jgi:putative ABC transport system permease protein
MLLKIAFRNALRQKRRTIFTLLTMFGGFTLASISIGWSDGSYSRIIEMFTRNRLGHIQVHGRGYLDKPSLYTAISDFGRVGQKIESVEGVEVWTPRFLAAGLASFGERTSAVQILGIDPVREERATYFSHKIIRGQTFRDQPAHEAIVGKGLAEVLQIDTGDEAVIVSQAADGSIANDLYQVVGIVDSGDQAADRTAFYLHLQDAQDLFVLEGKIHEMAVIVANLSRVQKITDKIRSVLADDSLEVTPWQEFAKAFYRAMKADVEGMWVTLFVIILIVAVGVLNTVLMAVLERTREYGVLRALGTRPAQLFWQVIIEVNFIALGSIVLGTMLSVLINHLLSLHGIHLPASFTYGGVEFSALYSAVTPRSLYIPAVTVFLAASLVSIFPALRAARIAPARAMRMH